MPKLIIIFVCMSLAFFGSLQSFSLRCQYNEGSWSSDPIYCCYAVDTVSITSPHAAQIDSFSGYNKRSGHKNDNVEGFVVSQGITHYFPRGLNKYFKNLKLIQIGNAGLKEIHQSDLKDFPKLTELYLGSNDVEILEENLFEFNPRLREISFMYNKISHIDPNVFDKLTNLKSLFLQHNTCIDMNASSNQTAVQNVIKAVKTQCNVDYSNLEQKVKNLEIESENLNSEKLKEKLENLENEIKNSKFPNHFQQKVQDLKAMQDKKAQDESTTPKTTTTTTTTETPKEPESIKFKTCSALELKIDEIAANLNYCVDKAINGTNSNKIDNDLHQNEQCAAIKEDLDTKLEILEENMENFKMAALREIQNIKNAVKDAHHGLAMSINFKADKIERKIDEQNRKLEEKLAKIMRGLKIGD